MCATGVCFYLHVCVSDYKVFFCSEKASVCCYKGGLRWVSWWWLLCLCGHVWHNYHSASFYHDGLYQERVCVCVAGISQVPTTTLYSTPMECRRTSLNRWVTSLQKSMQVFNHACETIQHILKTLSNIPESILRCFYVLRERCKSLFKMSKHSSESGNHYVSHHFGSSVSFCVCFPLKLKPLEVTWHKKDTECD